MRRSVVMLALTALLTAPLLALAPSAASADTATPAVGPAPATLACIASAIDNGTPPTDALNTCLDPSKYSPAVATSASLAGPSCSQAVQDPFTLDGVTM